MRLIDANALLEGLTKYENPTPNKSGYDFLCGIATAITEIEDAPTVDAVEVVHGRWTERDWDAEGFRVDVCSVCESHFCGFPTHEMNYCPHCGAKMDLEG